MIPPEIPQQTRLAASWFAERTFKADDIPSLPALLAAKRDAGVRISVAIPSLNEAATIGNICAVIHRDLMQRANLVDELVVLDGDSVDETALQAQAAGARVVDVSTLMGEVPLCPGKGESLWRSLTALSGDVVVWIDGDIRGFGSHFVTRLVAPILLDPEIDFVKGHYERPLEIEGHLYASGGGRVTELLARPLLNRLFPELAGFLQPLAGEYAGRAELLRRVPFFSGYSVEVGLLIDLLDVVGLDGMSQVDLGRRVHRNRPLEDLMPMAFTIAGTILRRAEERGRISSHVNFPVHPLLRRESDGGLGIHRIHEIERPPIVFTPPYLEALRSAQPVGARAV
jgi:glucosyl-3-phosphoglycerate synthase